MVIFYIRMKKVHEIQLTKTKWTWTIEKMKNRPCSPKRWVASRDWSLGRDSRSLRVAYVFLGRVTTEGYWCLWILAVFFFLDWISLCLLHLLYSANILFLLLYFIRVLTRSSPVSSQDFYCSLRRDQSRDVTPRFREGGWFFNFWDCSRPFCFWLVELHYDFSISYVVLTFYVHYFCIWLGF